MSAGETGEDTGSDEASEGGSDHVAGVEDSHARGDLFLRIKER
jgi:hypothetical protein